jgi:NitT/TauT family transport system substrate-binding protein
MVCACAFGCMAGAHAESNTVRIMVGGVEKQIYLPATLAERLGYFKEQGLEVELLSDASGVNGTDELLSGAVHGVIGFYDHTIDLQAKGKFVQSVVQFGQAPGEAQLVASRLTTQIRSPADFKGRTLGVTGLGSSTHVLTRYLALAHGVNLREIGIIAVGSGAGFAAAMREGRIDSGMTTEPTVSRMLQAGEATLLVDLRTPQSTYKVLDGFYPGACLYMATPWIHSHRTQVQKLANALVKALKYIDAHNAQEIAVLLPAAYYLGDRARYIEALENSKSMFIADGSMPPSGPATVLKVLRAVDRAVRGKTIDLSQTYTTEFVAAAR